MESQYEKIIEDIQDQCEFFAGNIIPRLCKRAIHKMNSWNVKIGTDDYPTSFNFFDILSIEHQSKSFDEISPLLQDAFLKGKIYEPQCFSIYVSIIYLK